MQKLLLHICCAPDQTVGFERTCEEYEVTGFFSNSCIEPRGEYFKRLSSSKFLSEIQGIELVEDDYFPDSFLELSKGFEKEPEKGKRCKRCVEFRMRRVAEAAKKGGFDIFATTLTVSPHKDAEFINRIGMELAVEFDIDYLETNFKKQDGFKRSVELSKKLGIYRQDYCGCRFSLKNKKEREKQRLEEQEEAAWNELKSDNPEEQKIIEVTGMQNRDVPPGAFFKPVQNLSRRFREGKNKRR